MNVRVLKRLERLEAEAKLQRRREELLRRTPKRQLTVQEVEPASRQ
jgi:hypothetical protein